MVRQLLLQMVCHQMHFSTSKYLNKCVQMYGQYTRELSKFARQEAERRHRFNVPTDSQRCSAEFDSPSSSELTDSGTCKSYREYLYKRITVNLCQVCTEFQV